MKEVKEQFSSIEGDNQYLQQAITESETIIGKLDETNRGLELRNREFENEIKMKQLVIASNLHPGQPSSNQQPVVHVTGTYKPTGAEFTMTDFDEFKRDNDSWYSPHFYTHPNGYKMCLCVDANGSGSGRGTHLSVYVYLMKGEFDDHLKWPFHGEISVKLVNQDEDQDHVVRTVHFDETTFPEVTTRVTKAICASKGTGKSKFLSHTDLQPKFLKGDCIKLCIKKVVLH